MKFFNAPHSLEDIIGTYHFTYRKKWRFSDLGNDKYAALMLGDGGVDLTFSALRKDFSKYRWHKKITTSAADTRILLKNSFISEDPFTSVFKSDPANLTARPSRVILQQHSRGPIVEEVDELAAFLPGLGEWFDKNLLEFDSEEQKFKDKKKTTYYPMQIGEYFTIEFNTSREVEINSEPTFTARQESYIIIRFTKPATLDYALRMHKHIETFFNFIFPQPHHLHIFRGISTAKRKKFNTVKYILQPGQFKGKGREDGQKNDRPLFTFNDVANIDNLFISWVIEYEKIEEVAEAIVLLKSSKVTEQFRFTTLVNALEAIHRRYFNRERQAGADFQSRVRQILQQINDARDRKLVKTRLKYANEIFLQERLDDLIVLAANYGLESPESDLLGKIVVTRNYFTHGDLNLRESKLTDDELYTINGYLGRSLKVLLLHVLGMDEESLKNIVEKSWQFESFYRDEPREI